MSSASPRRRVSRHRAKDYWKVATHLMEVVQAKFEYEDSGEVYTQAAAKRLLLKAERFVGWAEGQVG